VQQEQRRRIGSPGFAIEDVKTIDIDGSVGW
jgi:hypothetical protein